MSHILSCCELVQFHQNQHRATVRVAQESNPNFGESLMNGLRGRPHLYFLPLVLLLYHSLFSRGCHYIYLLSETCIILASTSSQRYQLSPLMQEHAVLISTYVQHYHRDSAEHSYYPCGRVEIKLETVRMPTASSSGKHQRGFTQPTNLPPKKHLQIV